MTAFYDGFMRYMRFYHDYALDAWNDMGPTGYGMVLVSIGIFGWLLMGNGTKAK